MPKSRPITVRLSAEQDDALQRLAAADGVSASETVRRALAGLPAGAEEQAAEQGASLLARIREFGHLGSDDALAGQPVTVDVIASRRVVIRWSGHTFQEIGGRLVVARRRLDGTTEIAYLDGPEPDEPDVAKFFEDRVLV